MNPPDFAKSLHPVPRSHHLTPYTHLPALCLPHTLPLYIDLVVNSPLFCVLAEHFIVLFINDKCLHLQMIKGERGREEVLGRARSIATQLRRKERVIVWSFSNLKGENSLICKKREEKKRKKLLSFYYEVVIKLVAKICFTMYHFLCCNSICFTQWIAY